MAKSKAGKVILRDRKISRTGGVPSSAQLECTLFFDRVPEEILEKFLKFLSPLPHAANWDKLLKLNSIIGIYGVRGVFGTFIGNRFRTLCISRSKDCDTEQRIYNWEVPKETMLWTSDIGVAHDFVLKGGGKYLRAILVGDGVYDERRNGRTMVKQFLRGCPMVSSLSVVEEDGVWVSTFSQRLEKLQVVGSNPGLTIPESCTSLVELNIDTAVYRLKDFDTIPIKWDKIGSKLEKLLISTFPMSVDDLKRIRRHCNALKDIRIYAPLPMEDGGRNVTEFFASYGDQIEFLRVSNMPDYLLRTVSEKCPNARFEVDLYHRPMLPVLTILGPRLHKLDLKIVTDSDAEEWRAAWNMCSNLEVLRMEQMKVEEIRSIMSTPKHQLKEIYIRNPLSISKTIMDIIAEGTGNVEILKIFGPITSLDTFDKFIEKNKTALRSVALIYSCGLNEGRLIEKFLECRSLEDISSSPIPVQSVLSTLKNRGIHFSRN